MGERGNSSPARVILLGAFLLQALNGCTMGEKGLADISVDPEDEASATPSSSPSPEASASPEATTEASPSPSPSPVPDTTAPSAPSAWNMTSPSTGSASSDTTPEISGTASEDGATITLYLASDCSSTALGTAIVSSGAFSFSGITLSSDGALTFYFKIADTLGNSSSCASSNLSYTLDTTAPASHTVSINGGDVNTYGTSATLTLAATDATTSVAQMCVAEASDCSSCTYETYSTSKALTLSSGVGTKTVAAKFKDAAGNESSCVTDSVYYYPLSVGARYSAGSNWNDYVQTADTSQVCAGTESGYSACIHGGEVRRVTTAETSCTSVSMTDTLGVFDWTCSVSSGYAVLDSSLKTGKGLKDLVDAAAWKTNSVTLTTSEGSWTNDSASWWSNTVQAATANSGGSDTVVTLGTTGTIYTISSSTTTAGYNINADEVGLVVLGDAVLTWTLGRPTNCATNGESGADHRCLLSVGSQKFAWLEGSFHAGTDGTSTNKAKFGVYASSSDFIRVHNSTVQNTTDAAIKLYSTDNSTVSSGALKSIYTGIHIAGGTRNYLVGVAISNPSSDSVVLDSSANYNVFKGLILFAAGAGTTFNSSGSYNIVTESTVMNGNTLFYTGSGNIVTRSVFMGGAGSALRLGNNAHGNVFAANTAANSGSRGIHLDTTHGNIILNAVTVNNTSYNIEVNNANYTTIAQVVGASSTYGIAITGTSAYNKFTGNVVTSSNTTACSVSSSGTNPGLVDTTCAAGTGSNSTHTGVSALETSFIGKLTSDDASNASDSSGSLSYDSVTDWTTFENAFRGWGKDGSAFPNSDHRGAVASGATARIWDWSLDQDVSIVRGTTGAVTTANGTFTAGSDCPSQAHGDQTLSTTTACSNGADTNQSDCETATATWYASQTFLKNAIELVADGIGDDDGLCESSEACLYAPNFGAYQGHGTLSTCTFKQNGGSISGVTMYGYGTNGR